MDKHSQEPKRILRSTLAMPSKTSGTTVKRLKISNQKVKELQVTGTDDSYFTEVAVEAIKGIKYTDDRCVEMLKPSDWTFIDPDDIDLVLCKEPLRNVCSGKGNVKQITDIFESYVSRKTSCYNAKSYKHLDMIIIINSVVLEECKKLMNSKIFDECVCVTNAATGKKQRKYKGKKGKGVPSKMSESKQSASSGYTATIHETDSPALRSIKSKREYMISLPEDTSIGWISGCCYLPSGEIVFADFYNKKLKKLDRNYKVISTCDLPSVAVGMCYVGDNKVVVSLGEKLQFADVTGDMQLTISVDINTYCKGLTFHESYIYIVNERTVFIYSPKCKFIRELYTNNSKDAYFQDIAVSDDGQRIYISSWHMGLITIDSSGNHLHTFFDENLKAPFGICLDDRSNVLMCLTWLGIVVQFSSDGRQKVGQVIKTTDSVTSPSSLYFDKETSSLTVGGGGSNKICILELF